MLQLTQTIWLWALAGIAVPIIIHLWNVKQGKTLKVGSIAFLTESAKTPSRSLKLSDLLLLLLRCLLLAALALLLTKPFWENEVDITKEKGWFLIEKGEVKIAYNKFKPQIDSLVKAGFPFHYFDEDFKEMGFEDALENDDATTTSNQFSHWNLLKELNQKVPANIPVYLFTKNNLAKISGHKPAINLNLKWLTYNSRDSTSTWIESAYETSSDSIRVVMANSDPAGTYYTYQNITHQTSNEKFDVELEDGKTLVTYKDTSKGSLKNTVEVDTSANVITVFTDKFSTDASYVKAALDAISDFTKRKMNISTVNNVQSIPSKNDWLFWLSGMEIPAGLNTSNVFLYEKGQMQKAYSFISNNQANEQIASFYTINKEVDFEPIWNDGFNRPLLAREPDKNVYHFYSRFNPQWNDLPWSNQFPQMMLELIYPSQKTLNVNDKRLVDQQQILPTSTVEETLPKQELLLRTDLSKPLWILAFILLLTERIISFRRKKFETSGGITR